MITVYHNPRCGTSRAVLEIIRRADFRPCIVEYLKTPPSRAELVDLISRAGLRPRELLREQGTLLDELHLLDPATGDAAIIDAMIAQPILINRPIVVTPKGVRQCRPADVVRDILPR